MTRSRIARRTLLAFAGATALALGAAPGALAQGGQTIAVTGGGQRITVTSGGGPPWPSRTLVLTAPGGTVTAGSVHVVENGTPVGGVVVTPISHARHGDFGVVLMIDTSGSMAGTPIKQAMMAARALVAGLTADQEISVIEFTSTAHVLVPLTANHAVVDRALATVPRAAGGTHIFDVAAIAERELIRARVAVGDVIIMSDGGDVGSRLTAESAAALGRPDHYQIYTVGVRDRYYDGRVLTELAQDGHGTYVAAAPAQLHNTLTALQSQLGGRYVLRYRSLLALAQHVNVSVSVDGVPGVASLAYLSPSPPVAHVPTPFWGSTAALVGVALVSAVLIGAAIAFLLLPRLHPETVRTRIMHFTDTGVPAIVAPPVAAPRASLIDQLETSLRDSPRWQRFREALEVADIRISPLRLVALSAAATVLLAILVAAASGIALLVLPVLAAGPLIVHGVIRQRLRRRRRLFSESLPAHLQEIASAMRAGHTVTSALAATTSGAAEPTRSEFGRVVADERLGLSLDAALEPVAERMASPEVSQLALVATLQDRSGGNMAEVLDRLADAARQKVELRRELAALTAQARLSRYIVTGLPIFVLALLSIVNPGYERPLFHTTIGLVLLCLAFVMIVAAYFVMRKITEIEV